MRYRALVLFAAVAATAASALCQTTPSSGKTGEPLQASDPIRVEITSPRENQVVPDGKVTFAFDVKNYTLATGGNHLHLIVDGKPYQAVYDPASFAYPETLTEGVHTAVAFASRPWHETWKDPESISVVTFYVGKKTGARPIDYAKPLLLFSRPKGAQEGADMTKPTSAARVLLDFYLWNVDLSPGGYTVEAGIDGKKFTLDQWRPYWVTGLASGTHTFTLRLLDKNGRAVKTPYAPYSRDIEVKDAPASATGLVHFSPVVPGPDGNGFSDGMMDHAM
jgi:hypothetical protein